MKACTRLLLLAALASLPLFLAASVPQERLLLVENRYLKNIRQLTSTGKSGEGYFSPDGRQIIFQSQQEGSPYYLIYLMNSDGTGIHRVSPRKGKCTCSYFSPDGKKILFSSTFENPATWDPPKEPAGAPASRKYAWDFDPSYAIYLADPDGSHRAMLTHQSGYHAEASFSHDGSKIVFTSNRDGDLDLYVMDRDGGNIRRITNAPGYDGGPFFAPDDREIVFRSFRGDGKTAEIYLVNADGSNERPITHLKGVSWAPYFHPDGKRIVFSSNFEGNFELYLVNRDGSGLKRLTYHAGFDALPVFSPDGKKLLWTSTRPGESQLFIADFVDPEGPPEARDLGTSPQELQEKIEALSSPELAGREAGTPGGVEAARLVAGWFQGAGLKPLGDGSYFQSFNVITGVELGPGNALALSSGKTSLRFEVGHDFRPVAFSPNARASGEVILVGYGDFSKARGKIALAYRGSKGKDPHGLSASVRHKAAAAQAAGARALLLAPPPDWPLEELIPLRLDDSPGRAAIPVISVSREVKTKILSLPHPTLTLATDLHYRKNATDNVVGILPGADPTAGAILLGAHYDHLGLGQDFHGSLKPGEVHPGADDNASGVAGLVTLARYFTAHPPRHTVLFVAFGAEERGTLGSLYYVSHPIVPLSRTLAMLNMDMVGRLTPKGLVVAGVGSSPSFPYLVRQAAARFPVQVRLVQDGFGPSDHGSFFAKNVPVIHFFTGAHDDYHKPSDTPEKINSQGELLVLGLMKDLVLKLDQQGRLAFSRPKTTQLRRTSGGFRIYLGTVPDYAAEVEGVRLQGVQPGSPAEKAGLRPEDTIVRFGKREIRNIYDYVYALQEHRPGESVGVTVIRDGRKMLVRVLLGSRGSE